MRRLRLQVLRWRQYSVPGPNSLWHIDGNHKLIRSVIIKYKQYIYKRKISIINYRNFLYSFFHSFLTDGDLLFTVVWMDSAVWWCTSLLLTTTEPVQFCRAFWQLLTVTVCHRGYDQIKGEKMQMWQK